MTYKIVWTDSFGDSFKKLDQSLQKRIAAKIEFLAQNPNLAERVAHVPTELNNLLKYKVGSWRVLF